MSPCIFARENEPVQSHCIYHSRLSCSTVATWSPAPYMVFLSAVSCDDFATGLRYSKRESP